ncbi:MAG: hypothetical protein JWQ49_99 [Edaphobacter sp.]|nr:hypothetical protein [Edaphobacter sp.]
MSRPKKTTAKPKVRSWRDYPDSSHTNRLTRWPSPESLSPDASTTFDAVSGNISARAIVDSYACRLPVITMTLAEVLA